MLGPRGQPPIVQHGTTDGAQIGEQPLQRQQHADQQQQGGHQRTSRQLAARHQPHAEPNPRQQHGHAHGARQVAQHQHPAVEPVGRRHVRRIETLPVPGRIGRQRRRGQAVPPHGDASRRPQALLVEARHGSGLDPGGGQQHGHGQRSERAERGMQQRQGGKQHQRPGRLERGQGGAIEQRVAQAGDRTGIALQGARRHGLARAVQQRLMRKRVIEPQTGALQDALARRVDAQQTERRSRCRGRQQPELPGARPECGTAKSLASRGTACRASSAISRLARPDSRKTAASAQRTCRRILSDVRMTHYRWHRRR